MAQRSITSATRSKELWTPERIAAVTERLTGVRYHPAWAWALLRHRLGLECAAAQAAGCRA